MQPDLEHLHHRLLKAGLSTRRVATLLYFINGGLVILGLLLTIFQSRASGIFLIALLATVNLLMRHMAVIELRDTGRALLSGFRRPTHSTARSMAYPFWDMFCLAGTMAAVMWFFESLRLGFWHAWFMDLPVWVTPTFSLLAISRVYVIAWNRARLLDVLMLLFTLQTGLLLSLGIALLIDPSHASQWYVRTLILGAIAHPAMVWPRMFYRLVEELVQYFQAQAEPSGSRIRIALYGAGSRCQLFLKERGMEGSHEGRAREIIGLIDDEPTLRSQWVYGFHVIGSREDLPHLIARYRISEIVITADLLPNAREAVLQLALQHSIRLTEWCYGERELAPGMEPHSLIAADSPVLNAARS